MLMSASAVQATVTCTVSGPALTFGTINPYSGYPYSTSGNATYSCTNSSTTAVTAYACLSIGTGSGGTTSSNRTLAAGSSKLPVQITGGSGYPSQVGDGTAYGMEGPLPLSLGGSATVSGTYALAVTLPSPSSTPAPGSYNSSFSGTDAQDFISAPASAPSNCAAVMAGSHTTAQANFSIAVVVPTQCTVTATSMAFPTASVLKVAYTATATIASTCNASTPVTIALDDGATGTGPTTRRMMSGANAITYGIYRDAAGTLPWGATSGTNTGSLSSGTGTLTAYGIVPPQTSPAPGTYNDVVNVTITY